VPVCHVWYPSSHRWYTGASWELLTGWPPNVIGSLVVLVVLVCASLARSLGAKHRDRFEISDWASAYFLFLFAGRTLYLLAYGSPFLGSPPFAAHTVDAWSTALWYLILAYLLFVVGYQTPFGKAIAETLPSLPPSWSLRRSRWLLIGCLVVASISVALLVRRAGGWSAYVGDKQSSLTMGGITYLTMGTEMLRYALTIGAVWSMGYRRIRCLTWGLLLPAALAVGALSGSKSQFLTPVLTLVMVYHYLVKPMRLRHLAGFGLFVVLVFPFFNAFRHAGPSGLAGVFSEAARVLGDPSALLRSVVSRFHDMDAVITVVRDTPQVMDFQYGRTFLPAVTAWIPRSIWPDKPVVSFGKVFAETYFAAVYAGTGSAASVTVLGEGYVNFHVAGMLWTALGIGVVMRLIYEYTMRRVGGMTGLFLYTTLFKWFMIWEANLAGFLPRNLLSLAIAVMLCLVISRQGYRVRSLPTLAGRSPAKPSGIAT
jgi:hypothetical protein